MIVAIIGLVIGVVAGAVGVVTLGGYWSRRTLAAAEEGAERLLADAAAERDVIMEQAKAQAADARERALQGLVEREKDVEERLGQLSTRSEEADKKTRAVDGLDGRVTGLRREVAKVRQTLGEMDAAMIEQLAVIAGTTAQAAGEELLETIGQGLQQEAQARLREMEAEAKETAENEARRLLVDTTQRLTVPIVPESSMSTMDLTERELAKTLAMSPVLAELQERTAAVFTVNEENQSIHVSAPDPVNRELAKVVFVELLKSGRNRGQLSQLIDRQARQLDQSIRRAGTTAAREAGCPNLPAEVVATLGRLTYRYSYGQNQLTHAIETARLAAMLATELGADVQVARAGGLLHDLGKAIDRDVEGTHAALGARLAADAGVEAPIVHCIEAHHEEVDPNTTEALITIVADAASGGRPGARRESLENYLAKLQALEAVAYTFPGVEKCYAIQAGRELRVMVDPKLVGDDGAARIAMAISQRIQETLEYPGQIKVMVIRELRTVEQTRAGSGK
ncbi:MAG TPA: Rnase Y domain-containing protein [Dehalococcoidia bacterium]|nr:Rnase Y domain-containing protein [Dehalococcoidia bacterium]